MRRNTVTIIKYLLFAAFLVIVGPLTLKFLFKSGPKDEYVETGRGLKLPHSPDRKDQHEIPEISDTELKKIDWHNYKLIEEERSRTGPGEQGSALILGAEDEKHKDELYKVNGFNAFASDKISLERSVKDIRHNDCRSKKYLNRLPNASVVVPFHNEHWSTLLRTAHSVINRSPKYLIHEILLVDDYSTKEFLKEKLDNYLKEHFTNVRVIRAQKREGLIRARLLGAKHATGQVLIFLDSHCEANINWLPPLLEPIAQDKRTVVCPFIDIIDYETFAYRAQDEGARGAFDWEFFYKRLPLLKSDLEHPAEPFKSPVMAGGLFAINREWFWTLGGYDPGLDIWGGEQYELSFKIWQCGGQMVDAPCSRIGHIYRKFAPFPNPGVGDFIGRNYRRVADVWMDEYAEFIYKRRPHYRSVDPGDISKQREIRKKLNCKSFKWFITEVAFDLVKVYPPIEPKPMAEGEIRSVASNLCIDTRFKGGNERFQLEPCITDGEGANGEQTFEFSWHKDIRPKKRNVCFDVSQSINKAPIILFGCHNMQGNQRFKYKVATSQIYHPVSGQCLDSDGGSHELFMTPCDETADTQKWKWSNMNTTIVIQDWDVPLD
ncbi:putative polypeptide N-acetylgalactosaminyltransferase 10 [Gigantopelta aegis]|uniref:putative polypeptide N-acetylgalactosaminyltransferase 10 n=1 Tax=Gigantopelta aegis TaxID=1735272 RepID=UPI001B887927|nr:putative polypeptide N-acetylgalactosaminyltransferase 10 [Gigantopelta aegis]